LHDAPVTRLDALQVFANALAGYDRPSAAHGARVRQGSTRVGTVLGLGAVELEALGWSALLHDLGKVSVAEEILRKRGPLTTAEWAVIKRHPIVGADLILSISEHLEPIAAGVRSHHERWDGAGYPNGLAGDAIPLAGRIITIVDVFDSMTSPRPYRRGDRTENDVLSHLQTQASIHFDPSIVPVFVELHHRELVTAH
jgi:HD-GYP domain-containing protein (c-di-GMP phosphodiesterase class II)